MGVIKISEQDLKRRTLPIEGYEWVEMTVDSTSDDAGPMVSFVVLKPKDDPSHFLPLEVSPQQASHILLGKYNLGSETAYQTPYHMLRTLAASMDLQLSRVVIDAAEPRLSRGKVEIRRRGGEEPLFYLDTSGGEAVAVAAMLDIPLFALKNQLILEEGAEGD